jgi:hypothetical protein
MLYNNINEPQVQRYLNSKVTRTDIIQHLIDLRGRGDVIYLELGVFHGENITKIQAAQKFGVDPGAEGVQRTNKFRMTNCVGERKMAQKSRPVLRRGDFLFF